MHVHLYKNPETDVDAVVAKAAELQPDIDAMTNIVETNTFTAAQSSVNAPTDVDSLVAVRELVATVQRPQLRYIFVVGIGGSNLGTKAVYDALYGYTDVSVSDRAVMLFLDTNSDAHLSHYLRTIVPTLTSADEYMVVTVSKSGGTTETIMNTELLVAALQEAAVYAPERVVAITDANSALELAAKQAGWYTLSIPAQVGGRYSVLTAVGLFPLALIGVDIDELLAGARDMREACLISDVADNPAAQSAAYLARAYEAGQTIHDSFIFQAELESLGKWYRQLLGESIGKEKNNRGEVVHVGLTPTVSIGSTDLHSVGQLYLGGPKDKVTTFIYCSDESTAHTMPKERMLPNMLSMLDDARTSDVRTAILTGTQIAYQKQQLPYIEIELEGVTPYELGAFLQFKMIETMYLGALFAVNPFDQPNVEAYKTETKRILEVK